MGDSSCLLQGYSHEASNKHREVNSVSALGESITFGRFLSESLDWGKWSSFSHNRYLEEVERYSKPGSVAQKKAYFEAHYRNMAAARKSTSVLEHKNSITAIASEIEDHESCINNENHIDSFDPEVETKDVVTVAVDVNDSNSGGQVEEAGQVSEDEILKESFSQIESLDIVEGVENQNKVSDNELDRTSTSEKQPLKESFVSNEGSVDSAEKKSKGPVSKSTVRRSPRAPPSPASKPPFSPIRSKSSFHCMRENNSTPRIMRRCGMGSNEKKKPIPKSLHMSNNLNQYQSGANTTSKILEKGGDSKVASVVPKASQECSHHFRTPTKLSIAGIFKWSDKINLPNSSIRTWKVLKDSTLTKTPPEQSSFKKKITLSVNYSKSSIINGQRQCSPVASSLCVKTHQRTEKRKELFHNLEDKFDKKGAKKLQLQETSKEKTESELKNLRQGLCFKARPLPHFYRHIEPLKVEMRKEKAETELRKLCQSLCFKAKQLPDFNPKMEPTKLDMKKLKLMQHQSPKHGRTSNSKAESELNNVPPKP